MSGETRTLYRPVGLSEAQLILEAGSKAFPPRRTEQPIFYPVLNFQYAEQIARDWNTRSPESGFAGFVTQFRIDEQFGEGYKGTKHRILDIYAEEMFAMLYVTSWLSNQDFRGEILANRHAVLLNFKYWATHDLSQLALNEEQVSLLRDHADRNRTTFPKPLLDWPTNELGQPVLPQGEQVRFLRGLADIWRTVFPELHLVGSELVE